MNNKILEVIGFNIESCLQAQGAGAQRIELCDNPGEGGTTASYGFIKAARKNLQIKLFPIIRPRGGDFLYTNEEFEVMKTDVKVCKQLECDGVVIGILNQDGTVDKRRCSELVELAYPLGVTFHRAFDRVENPMKAVEDIIEIGCERILTSGLKHNALNGAEMIATLIKQADERIIIMPGSGVRSDNIIELANKTGAVEFHSSARVGIDSKMKYSNTAMNEKLQTISIDVNEVKKMASLIANL
ncbi:MAG TPA: copper homeostasis protein CutC [Ferruginibacter sp.]|nr:copper homeostasis protein CutC [Ferruginibacter sp.]